MKISRNRSGFSMIEVLVASSILIVIVMMLAMLFQQTSLSWRTGVRRADTYMLIRSGFGAIQRDASAAVDQRTIPSQLRSAVGGNQQFNGSLQFFTLTGGGFFDANNNGRVDSGENMPFRALSFISYNTSGDRREYILKADGSVESRDSNVFDFVNRASGANQPTPTLRINAGPTVDSAGLPLYVTIEADVRDSGNALDIGAASAGPDKTWNTKDDIKTWVGEN